MHTSEIQPLSCGDRHVLTHLGIPNAVRLAVYDASFWYYDSGSRTLHEWLCSCNTCTAAWRHDTPSKRCRFKRKYIAYDRWPEVDEADIRAHG